jgi:hypothetical protein
LHGYEFKGFEIVIQIGSFLIVADSSVPRKGASVIREFVSVADLRIPIKMQPRVSPFEFPL